MPSTTAELEIVLQAFKDKDPNGNGKADEIPMLGCNGGWSSAILPFMMSAFILQDSDTNLYLNENKKVTFAADTDEYKQGLMRLNILMERGLLDPASFTQSGDEAIALVKNPDATLVGIFPASNPQGLTGKYNDFPDHRSAQYKALAPLEDPNGFRGICAYEGNTITTAKFVISKNCKTPEIAFRWADGWYEEETTFKARNGFENEGWKKPQEGALGLNGKPALYENIFIEGEVMAERVRICDNILGKNTAELREGRAVDTSTPKGQNELEYVLHTASQNAYEPSGRQA